MAGGFAGLVSEEPLNCQNFCTDLKALICKPLLSIRNEKLGVSFMHIQQTLHLFLILGFFILRISLAPCSELFYDNVSLSSQLEYILL